MGNVKLVIARAPDISVELETYDDAPSAYDALEAWIENLLYVSDGEPAISFTAIVKMEDNSGEDDGHWSAINSPWQASEERPLERLFSLIRASIADPLEINISDPEDEWETAFLLVDWRKKDEQG